MSSVLIGLTFAGAVAGVCASPGTMLEMAQCNPSLDCASAESTMEMSQCNALRLDAVEAELREALTLLLQTMLEEKRTAERDQLIISQAAWENYRSAYCSAVYERYGTGSLRGVAHSQCLIDRATLRRDELRQYDDP